MKAVSQGLSTSMLSLRILGCVIIYIYLQSRGSYYASILFVLWSAEFNTLDRNSGETGGGIDTLLPLNMITSGCQSLWRFCPGNSSPYILLLEMLIILLQIMRVIYWLLLGNYFLSWFQSVNCILYWTIDLNDNLWRVIGRAESLHNDRARGLLVVILWGRTQRDDVILFQLEDVLVACGSPRLLVKVFYSGGGNGNLMNLLFHLNTASLSKFSSCDCARSSPLFL